MKKGFDLASVLKDVPDLGTNREQIEYIKLDLIDEDPNNFYALSDIDKLADNIDLCGLQQPIRVRKQENGRYKIVSGHRRRAAVEMLSHEKPEHWSEVPCIIETDQASPALQQLRLIYANSSTRVMTSAEYSKQAEEVTNLLYQLKEEGYEFPGRMRDHVAQAVGISKSKLSRLKVIRENLEDFWMPFFEDNSLHETTANLLAQLPGEEQYVIYEYIIAKYGQASSITASVVEKYKERLASMKDLICPTEGIPCENMDNKKDATIRCGIYDCHSCGKCCAACYKLTSCRYACPKLADQIKQQKAENREQKRKDAEAEAARNAPKIDQIRDLWIRFGTLRERAGKSVADVFSSVETRYTPSWDDPRYAERERGLKIDLNTTLPIPGGPSRYEIQSAIAIADLFGCTLDQLFGRVDLDAAEPENVPTLGTVWQTGEPINLGEYVVILGESDFDRGRRPVIFTWTGLRWEEDGIGYDEDIDGSILGWMPMMEEDHGD